MKLEALAKNRATIQIIGGFIVLMFIYNLFLKPDNKVADVVATNSPHMLLGADLIKISQDLSKATLSRSLFSSPSYLYLIDFSTPLPEQPVGRNNPFEVIGRQ